MLYRNRYAIALLLSVAIWGANVPILKIALRDVPTSVANAVRFSLSAATLGTIAVFEMRRLGKPFLWPMRAHGGWLVLLGLMAYVGYQEAFILGLTRTSSTSIGLLMATAPLWTALVAHLTHTQRVQRAAWAGLLLSLAGATVVVVGSQGGGGEDTLGGNVLILAGAMLWSGFTVLSRRLTGKVPPATATFWEIVVALPVLVLLALPDAGGFSPAAVPLVTWLALAFSGVLSVGLTLVVWNVGVQHLGPTTTGAYSNLTPLATALAAYLILGDRITPLQVAGGALILGGLVWMRRGLSAPSPQR